MVGLGSKEISTAISRIQYLNVNWARYLKERHLKKRLRKDWFLVAAKSKIRDWNGV